MTSRFSSFQLLRLGKLLGNPGLQGQHAYLVVRTNKKKTSIKNLMT